MGSSPWGLKELDMTEQLLLYFYNYTVMRGFPGGSNGKEFACNVGELGLIPGLGGAPREGCGYPLQYSCLENSMDRGAGGLQSMGSQRV